MQAAVFSVHGSSSVLSVKSVGRPIPQSDQALVKVSATCINPIDIKLRKHNISSVILPKPKIPGTDIAGTIVTAPAGSGFSPGDKVMAMMPMLFWTFGGCAEYAAVPVKLLCHVPSSLPLSQAAALPLVSTTVVTGFSYVLDSLGGKNTLEGKKILVQAGSGGVGSIAIQWAKHVLGAEVVATTCSASKADMVRSLGADVVIDYKTQRFEDIIEDYDVVFDTLAYEYMNRTLCSSSKVLRRDGKGHYVHIGGSSPNVNPGDRDADWLGLSVPEARIDKLASHYTRQSLSYLHKLWGSSAPQYHVVFVRPDGGKLRQMSDAIGEGKVRPIVDKEFPLSEIAAAHDYVETGHTTGKVVVNIA
mmetsp:Transcript_3316/g.5181  ORF Transcript_3316/g.5181 Transcript_3316/m.5181 type:complete len:360 (-) Transcript_3316:144-1223(-)